MATSNAYTFAPSIADLTLEAFDRIQIPAQALTPHHMFSARMSANLELTTWASRGVNLWAVDQIAQVLTPGQAIYALDGATEAVLDAYLSVDDGAGSVIDYSLAPISRTDYANIARKGDQGRPTQYWFERIVAPQIIFWLVPDSTLTYTFKCWRLRRLQDASFEQAQQPDIHYRFTDSLAAGLAARLAEKFAPQLLQDKITLAAAAWKLAAAEDREMTDLRITPEFTGYFP